LMLPEAIHRLLLPTPTAQLYGSNLGGAAGRTGQKRLSPEALARSALLPTPTTKDTDHAPDSQKWPAHRRLKALLAELPQMRWEQGGLFGEPTVELAGGPWLSFREWMMGWPIGWSALRPLATGRFQEWLRWHGRR
jgi:hypothetical protein